MSLKTNDPNRKFEYCITHLSVKEPDEPHTYFHHKVNYGILDGLGESMKALSEIKRKELLELKGR